MLPCYLLLAKNFNLDFVIYHMQLAKFIVLFTLKQRSHLQLQSLSSRKLSIKIWTHLEIVMHVLLQFLTKLIDERKVKQSIEQIFLMIGSCVRAHVNESNIEILFLILV
jgi:hypothetical protein